MHRWERKKHIIFQLLLNKFFILIFNRTCSHLSSQHTQSNEFIVTQLIFRKPVDNNLHFTFTRFNGRLLVPVSVSTRLVKKRHSPFRSDWFFVTKFSRFLSEIYCYQSTEETLVSSTSPPPTPPHCTSHKVWLYCDVTPPGAKLMNTGERQQRGGGGGASGQHVRSPPKEEG